MKKRRAQEAGYAHHIPLATAATPGVTFWSWALGVDCKAECRVKNVSLSQEPILKTLFSLFLNGPSVRILVEHFSRNLLQREEPASLPPALHAQPWPWRGPRHPWELVGRQSRACRVACTLTVSSLRSQELCSAVQSATDPTFSCPWAPGLPRAS